MMDESASPPSVGRPFLLLVENSPAICAMLTEILSAHYRVEAVCDGEAAWATAQDQPFDLVIVGVSIHGRDSLGLIQALRAHAQTAFLPIVMLTCSADRALMLRCLAAGASNILLKPFTMTELLNCVQLELDLHSPFARPGG